MRRLLTVRLLLLSLVLLLSGCETLSKIGQVIMDPNTPVGKNNEQPSKYGVSLVAENNINPNRRNDPAPIEVQLIFMSDDSMLLSADYDQISASLKDTLGKNYIEHQDFTLLPGQFKFVSPAELDKKINYIGVVAHFSQPNKSQWKKAVRVEPNGHNYQLLVHANASEVSLKKEEQ